VREISPKPTGAGRRVGVVVARFHGEVADRLLGGCTEALRRYGVAEESITVVHVPGAFEVPLAADRLAASGEFDALVALGAVVRGETDHADLVARACAEGCAAVSRARGVPVAFEVLCCESVEQALARAGGEKGNRGFDAALVALRMAELLRALPAGSGRRP
jgi:6,7-dimethyl-8-ribityllumazine synthase